MPPSLTPFVSIIVPVFNDAARLGTCLAAIEKQTYPGDAYEVIVVDNGSDESPEPVVAAYGRAKFLVENKVGSYAARNTGLRHASGHFLAFTDADCIPSPQWLAKGMARIQQLDPYGLVAGHIHIFYKNPDHPKWVELYDAVTGLDQQKNVAVDSCNTANIFTHRSAFDRVGPFDEKALSMCDLEWARRVAAAGLPIVYSNEARIDHPARITLRGMMIKRRRDVGADIDFKADKTDLYRSRRFIHVLWKNFVPQLRDIWRHTDHQRLSGIDQRMKVAFVMLLMQYVDAFERVRVRFGGAAERR